MNIHVCTELAEIVSQKEIQELAAWLAIAVCAKCAEASLDAVSFKPQGEARLATSCAVLTTTALGENREPEYHLCYVYANGDNPCQPPAASDGPHLQWVYSLQPDNGHGQKLIAEVRSRKA